jgi:hypothetical protein
MNVKVLRPIPGYAYFPGDSVSMSEDMADLLLKKGYVEVAVMNKREEPRETEKKK